MEKSAKELFDISLENKFCLVLKIYLLMSEHLYAFCTNQSCASLEMVSIKDEKL